MSDTTGQAVAEPGLLGADTADAGEENGTERVTVRRLANGSLVPVATAPVLRAGGRRGERGMVSAEWAVAIIAAVSLAGVVIMIVGSGPVKDALLKFILLVIKQFSSIAGI